MSLISGWLALLGLALLVWLVVYVIRLNPKELRPAGPTVQVVSTTSRVSNRKSTGRIGTIVLWLIGILIAVLIFINIISIVGWVWDTIMHQGFGVKIVQPTSVVVRTPVYVTPTQTEVRTKVRDQCIRENEEEIVVQPVYGEPQRWKRVPPKKLACVIVDGKKPIDAQCSSSDEKPPTDASGPDYDCRSDVYAHWVRVMASNVEEGPVTAWIFFQDWR